MNEDWFQATAWCLAPGPSQEWPSRQVGERRLPTRRGAGQMLLPVGLRLTPEELALLLLAELKLPGAAGRG